MLAKNVFNIDIAKRGTSKNLAYDKPVPQGEQWLLQKFGACDINMGDNKSSVYTLYFGTTILKIISVTGSTIELPVGIMVEGDGTKRLIINAKNNSKYHKMMPCWIDARTVDKPKPLSVVKP